MYKIIGADGRQYGPVDPGQLRQWIREARANAQTRVQAEGTAEWLPLGTVPEFADQFAPPVPPPLPPAPAGRARKTNGFAVWGMVCGILNLLCCFCCCNGILGVLGLIFSIVGLCQINEFPELYEGRGYAFVGIILSALGLLLTLLFLVGMGMGHPHANYYWFNRRYY